MNLISIISTLLGIIASVCGGLAWYSGMVRKRYAAERDFQHIRADQQALHTFLVHEFDMLKNRLDHIENQLVEMKAVAYQLGIKKDG